MVVVPLHINPERLAERGPVAAIFVTDPNTPLHSTHQQQLRELYSLTPGEARLAAGCSRASRSRKPPRRWGLP